MIIALLLVIFALSAFIIGVLVGEKGNKKEHKEQTTAINVLKQKIKNLKHESVLDKKIKKEQKNADNYSSSEVIDYENAKKVIPPKILKNSNLEKNKISHKQNKARLVIIIDDVAFKYETDALKKLPYKITPSFFPPTETHPNTPRLAKSFNHYMVHMPMEAVHYPHPEPNTMDTTSSYQFIKKRVDMVKTLFPRAKFINNHTGSKFTANYNAMNKLFEALKADNLGFVDSKTTPYSKAGAVEQKFHIPIYSRNIFLDNKENEQYIQNQLRKAVHLAKKYGYAIAIGHPHKITIKTIKDSKKLLSQVEVVYIDELNKN